jgi:hypothetical protein
MQPGERLGVRGKERGRRRDNELNIGYSQYQFTNITNYLTRKRINIEGAKIRSWEELH